MIPRASAFTSCCSLPLAVYWQTVFEDYGFRDDYSHLRESREEPGKIVKFAASQGRPLYGACLETTFNVTDEVGHLPMLRIPPCCCWRCWPSPSGASFTQSGWTEVEAAAIGLGVALLPPRRWPPVGLSPGPMCSRFCCRWRVSRRSSRAGARRAETLRGPSGRVFHLRAGHPDLPVQRPLRRRAIVAVLLVRSGREPMGDGKWLAYHLSALIAGLAISYFLMQGLF